jgi:outer membrane scaffolding protein for murein synthesis (MipA/OmpV family)
MKKSRVTGDSEVSLRHTTSKRAAFKGTRRRNRLRQVGLQFTGTALAAILPFAATAELSNDSMIGPGLRFRPAYDGAQSQSLDLVPVIRHFGGLWFVRSTQGVLETGLRTELLPGLHAGAQLAYEPGRKASESEFLQNHQIASTSSGGSIGLHMEWDQVFGPVPITLLTRVRQNTDTDRGAQADLRLSVGVFQQGPVSAGIFTQGTWANAKSMNALYGLAPQQSAITGLPVFQPGSGLLFSSVGLLWSVNLNPKWVVVGNLERRRLTGDAANSPLVERLSNSYISAGITYRY